ncbi:MAG TPA: hypothetical protein VKY57_11295, partial [Chitinispirillaceae bacterium]|nr:hypothetical protein [Chitinispirillaceae bacterium]
GMNRNCSMGVFAVISFYPKLINTAFISAKGFFLNHPWPIRQFFPPQKGHTSGEGILFLFPSSQ